MPRKKCVRCEKKAAIGGQQKHGISENVAKLCIDCVKEDYQKGICPVCTFKLTSKSHANLCLPIPEETLQELEAKVAS